ncbi:hypothetical protein L8X52_08570 [Campylobacter lari]|nr:MULTISPECIES: hypothetical protein [Campylobacter]EGK8009091.1 hypothetical protein [Campylobacter lari]EGK8020256.1 hypothetical protein [Campylobacter lari]EGK8050096.1 hypothetical protein [Campylobacter lari]EGK8086646.1 hypothetical protein [Campylobacter lari]MBT0825215.1 hypothetical protein [Campylobacter lari]
MKELMKNIGLGLFINGSYSVINLTNDIPPYIITFIGLYVMWKMAKKGE